MKRGFLLLLLCGFSLASLAQLPPVSHFETNNVSATILGNGSCMLLQQENELGLIPCPAWEVPAGSGKETIFQHALWFGGLDTFDTLHLAAVRYSLSGLDYWPGPLKTTITFGTSPAKKSTISLPIMETLVIKFLKTSSPGLPTAKATMRKTLHLLST